MQGGFSAPKSGGVSAAELTKGSGPKRRLEYLDVAKGIGIALVVWAHASGPFSNEIYEFHMPLFFLISGYLHNDGTSLNDFFVRKLKSLYLPFIFWNIASVIVFKALRAYSYSVTQVGNLIVGILATFQKDGVMFGASWFLGALFVISVLFKVAEAAVGQKRGRPLVLLVGFALLGYFGYRISLDWMLSRTLILGAFYAVGYGCRRLRAGSATLGDPRWRRLIYISLFAVSCAFFAVVAPRNSAYMGGNQYTASFPVFVLCALAGSWVVIALSQALCVKSSPLTRLLSWFGRNSMSIVLWQFVAFRVVVVVQVLAAGAPFNGWEWLQAYYPTYSTGGIWWVVYFVVGMLVPIAWVRILGIGWLGRFLRKVHAI
ncbi:acyltransferase family protein [Olsenella sp. An188]|uniref:acyltransferase family protein n=1 Tax=Olsenella sp. An188 TaxID=1965579 RepID=UPI000B38AB1C|nr:acyltransferase family protein [Olsenella sp. An188]OUP37543.1 hypothetical protein B5F23_09435 [Olsenella sp. An188]